LHRSRKNQALDALVKLGWISPGPTLFFSVVRAPRSLSDRIKRVDVFGVSFSPSWCSPFLFWRKDSQVLGSPASSAAAGMVAGRAGAQEGSQPAGMAPWIAPHR